MAYSTPAVTQNVRPCSATPHGAGCCQYTRDAASTRVGRVCKRREHADWFKLSIWCSVARQLPLCRLAMCPRSSSPLKSSGRQHTSRTLTQYDAPHLARPQPPRLSGSTDLCLQYRAMYDKSINQPEEFWGEIASEFKWDKKVRPCRQ